MKKFWIGGSLFLLLAVTGSFFFLVSNLNSLVSQVIEKEGSEVTATKVAVAGVDISLKDGRGTMSGLTIASPHDFSPPQAFSLGEIVVDIDIQSVRSDLVVIEEVRVRAPVVNAEVRQDGSTNIGSINRNVKEYSAKSGGGTGGDEGDRVEGNQKRIRIKRFVFEEGRIEVDAAALGLEPRAVDLPAIRLDDVGGPQGALPSDIAKAVLNALTREAVSVIAKTELEEKVKDAVADEAEGQAKKLLGRISG